MYAFILVLLGTMEPYPKRDKIQAMQDQSVMIL